MPLNFTLVYDRRVNDSDDRDGDIAATPCHGMMRFTPTIGIGDHIAALTSLERPTDLGVGTFYGYLDDDGQLKNEPGGTPGLRLWGNDPDWGIERFEYRVTAELFDPLDRPVPFTPFNFDAPSSDTEFPLPDVMPKPGQVFGRGPGAFRLSSGAFDEDNGLVLQNADGSLLSPIEIPSGVLVFVDNGDGTLTVGL